MRRNTLMGAAAAAAVAISLSACSSAVPDSGTSGGGAQTINVLSNFTPDVARGKVLDKLINEFNKQNAGKYTVVSKSQPDWPTLQQQIRSSISAGSPPDVFIYNYNPTDLSREKSGKLMDWSQYLDQDPTWKSRFNASNLSDLTVDGQTVGLPADQSPALFYYNKALFAKAGITSFPKTWSEFLADAEKLKRKDIPALAMQTADDAWYSMTAFSYLADAAGGPEVLKPGANLDNEAITTAAEDTKKLLSSYAPADAVGANYSAASADFLGGRAAMVIDGPWLISSIQGQMKGAAKDVGVAAAPTLGDGKMQPGSIVTDSLNAWGAAKQTNPDKAKAVVAWMKFFTANSSAAQMAVDGQYPVAVKTKLSSSAKSKAPSQMVSFLDIANSAPNVTVQLQRNVTSSTQAKLPSMLESLALGRSTPDEFASELQQSNSK